MRTCLFFVIFMIAIFFGQAQNLFVGAQLGINHASARVSSNIGTEVTASNSFMAAALAEMKLGNGFAIRIEPSFVERSPEMRIRPGIVDCPTNTYDHRIRLNSMDIPLLFQYNFLDGEFTPVVFVGPNFSFITKSIDSRYYLDLFLQPTRTEMDLMRYTQSFETLLTFGAGAEFELNENMWLFLNGRYEFGMTNLLTLDYLGIHGTWKTSDIRLLAGAKFGIF